MDSTWIAAVVFGFIGGVLSTVFLEWYRRWEAGNVSVPEKPVEQAQHLETITAGDMVKKDPLRKRPGLGTLRHRAEMDSMKPFTDAEKRIQKNTEAMSL